MSGYTNTAGIPLSLAVFLATDNYDYDDDPNVVSATKLIKPLRQLILATRVPPSRARADVGDLISSRMGQAIHDGIERSWLHNHENALKALGYPPGMIRRVRINPDPETVQDGDIPIYMERRFYREVMGYRLSGKFDFLADGRLEDFKSTGVFTWMNNTSDEKHRLQGSIYRWLVPHLITKDVMSIQYIFTDWNAARARTEPKYPPKRLMERSLQLLSLQETERYITTKISLVEQYRSEPEHKIPLCSDDDLWRREPVFKYYKNPENTKRSTKNFDTYPEAQLRFIQDGSVGKVVEAKGGVTACKYCDAFDACTQKDALIASGDLVL